MEDHLMFSSFQMQDQETRKRKDVENREEEKPSAGLICTQEIIEKTTKMLIHVEECKKVGLVFGQGGLGQLGLGDCVDERKKPAVLSSIGNILQIVCGGVHTVALTDKNQIYSWGCNDDYALGRESNEKNPENLPGLVVLPPKYIPVKISAGDSHTAVLTECGSVFVCGIYRDSERKIGLITKDVHEKSLTLIYARSNEKGSHAVSIASGNDHLLILTANGRIYSCGSGQQGQLGRVPKATVEEKGGRRGCGVFFKPANVPFVCYNNQSNRIKRIKLPFVDIVCGSYHSFAIDREGNVYGWGLNNYGQLGVASTKESKSVVAPTNYDESNMDIDPDCLIVYRPILIGPISYFSSKDHPIRIAAGQHHTIFIETSTGEVYGVGRAEYGRLGIGTNNQPFYIHPIQANIKNIREETDSPIDCACGEVTSFIISKRGNLYSYGMGSNLQLALDDDSDCLIPTKATGKQLSECDGVIAASGGGQHTALLARKK